MKIMKTNALLLDNNNNKTVKENAAAEKVQAVNTLQTQGMNALMFQGLRNLMSNPVLAQETGVPTDTLPTDKQPTTNNAAQHSANNVSFGRISAGSAKRFIGAVLISAAVGLGASSCKDHVETYEPPKTEATPINITNIATNNVDFSAIFGLITEMQAERAQNQLLINTLIAQNAELIQAIKDGNAQNKEYFEKILARQDAQIAELQKANAKLDAQLTFLTNIYALQQQESIKADDYRTIVFAYLDTIVNLEADQNTNIVALKAALTAEVEKILAKLEADGSNFAQIMLEIKELINQNNALLADMLGELRKAAEDRLVIIARLEDIEAAQNANTEEVKKLREDLKEVNNTIKESAKILSGKLDDLNSTVRNGVQYLSQQMGWTEAQTLAALRDLGIKIDNNTSAQFITAGMLKGALDAIQKAAEKQNEKLDDLNSKVDDLNNTVGTLMEEYVARDEAKQEALSLLIAEQQKGNASLNNISTYVTAVLKNTEEMKGIMMVLSKDVKQLDKDLIKSKNDLAAALGVSTMVIDNALKTLGWTMAEINSMNTDRIIDALTNAINEQNEIIGKNGEKIDNVSDLLNEVIKVLQDNGKTEAEKLDEIKALLYSIDGNVSAIKDLVMSAIDQFNQYRADRDAAEAKLLNAVNQNNKNQAVMTQYLRALLASTNGMNEKLTSLQSALQSGIEDMNMGFKAVCTTIGISEAKLEGVLMSIGYTHAQIQAMTAAQIIAAINANTAATQANGDKLQTIIDKLTSMELTQEELVAIANELKEILGHIDDTVSEIRDLVITAIDNFNTYAAKREDAEAKLFDELDKHFKNQNSMLNYLQALYDASTQQTAELANLSSTLKSGITDMNMGFKAVCATIGISETKLSGLLLKLGYDMAQIQNMTAAQIIAAINNNTAVAQNTNAKIQTIIDKLTAGGLSLDELNTIANEIKALLGEIKDLIVTAIDNFNTYAAQRAEAEANLLNAVNQSVKNQQNMLKQLQALVKASNLQTAELANIKSTLESGISDMNMGFHTVCTTIGISEAKLEGLLMALGYSQAQIQSMTAAQIIAAINTNTAATQANGDKLQEIIDRLSAGSLTQEQLVEIANEIKGILGQISESLATIIKMLNQHFAQYNKDMANLLKWQIKQTQETAALRADVNRYGNFLKDMAGNIRELTKDVSEIKKMIKKGEIVVSVDYDKFKEIFEQANITVNMPMEEILQRLDTLISGQNTLAGKLEVTNQKLDTLGNVVSNDVIEAINNVSIQTGDDKIAEAIDALGTKLDALITAVKNLSQSFTTYANQANQAWSKNNEWLEKIFNGIKDVGNGVSSLNSKIILLNTYMTQANSKLDSIDETLKNLKTIADKFEKEYGRPITPEELTAILTNINEGNKEYYTNLLNNFDINPADFSTIEAMLTEISGKLEYQKDANACLGAILTWLQTQGVTQDDIQNVITSLTAAIENKEISFNCDCKTEIDVLIQWLEAHYISHEGVIGVVDVKAHVPEIEDK